MSGQRLRNWWQGRDARREVRRRYRSARGEWVWQRVKMRLTPANLGWAFLLGAGGVVVYLVLAMVTNTTFDLAVPMALVIPMVALVVLVWAYYRTAAPAELFEQLRVQLEQYNRPPNRPQTGPVGQRPPACAPGFGRCDCGFAGLDLVRLDAARSTEAVRHPARLPSNGGMGQGRGSRDPDYRVHGRRLRVARLIQTSLEAEEAPTKNRSAKTFIGVVGAGALALLAILLTNQANEVGSVLP